MQQQQHNKMQILTVKCCPCFVYSLKLIFFFSWDKYIKTIYYFGYAYKIIPMGLSEYVLYMDVY